MPQPPAVSHVGSPKCPHCLEVPDPAPHPVETIHIYLCPLCDKTFVILSLATEFTTFPTAIDPSDLHQT